MSQSLTTTFGTEPSGLTVDDYREITYEDLGMEEPPEPAGDRFIQAYVKYGLAGLGVFLIVPVAMVVLVVGAAFAVLLAPFAAWFWIASRTMFMMPALAMLPESYFRQLRWDATGVTAVQPTQQKEQE